MKPLPVEQTLTVPQVAKAMPIMGRKKTSYRIEVKDFEAWKKNLKLLMLRNIRLSVGPEPQCGREWMKKLIGLK